MIYIEIGNSYRLPAKFNGDFEYMLCEILNSKRNPEKNPTSADTKGNFKMSINKVNGLLCSNMFFQEATKVLLKATPKA